MNRYLLNTNLPDNDVTEVIVTDKDKVLLNKLQKLNIEYILSSNNDFLSDNISYHTDLNIFHKGKNSFIFDISQKDLIKFLPDADIYFTQEIVKSPYPYDCRLNVADIGDYIICNKDIIDSNIADYAKENNKKIIDVKQGYSKCSICIVDKNKFITDDPSIYMKTAGLPKISSILVSKGSVKLEGQNYGFIGGCSCLISKRHLLFNGDIRKHLDFDSIYRFLNDNKIKFDYIENHDIIDIGGIIPIKEKE